MPSRVTHFEIPIDDPDRAEKFYADVFGWTFQRYPGAPTYYGLASTGETNPGINGALFQRAPDSVMSVSVSVESVDDALLLVAAKGGAVLQPKAAVPNFGWFATCEDTEGNRIGLFQNDPGAA